MVPGKRDSVSEPDSMPWRRCGLDHDEWGDLLHQMSNDIVTHENIIGLEGLAKHGQLWEDWFDAYLDGPLRARYWCTKKRDGVDFSRDITTIRQVFRTTVSSIARDARLKLAHSTGAITTSSRASSVAPSIDLGPRTTPSLEVAMDRVKQAMKRLQEKKRLDAEFKVQERASGCHLRYTQGTIETDIVPLDINTSEKLIDRTGGNSLEAGVAVPLGASLTSKKRGRSDSIGSRDDDTMQDVEYNNALSNPLVVDLGAWEKASTAAFSWPEKESSSTLISDCLPTSPRDFQSTTRVPDLDKSVAKGSVEKPPAKRQKRNIGSVLCLVGDGLIERNYEIGGTGTSQQSPNGSRQCSREASVESIPENKSCNTPDNLAVLGQDTFGLSTSEQSRACLGFVSNGLSLAAEPGTSYASSDDESLECSDHPLEKLPTEPHGPDFIASVTDTTNATANGMISVNQPAIHPPEVQPSIGQQKTGLSPNTWDTPPIPTGTYINENVVQQEVALPTLHSSVMAMAPTLSQEHNTGNTTRAVSEDSVVPRDDLVENKDPSLPGAEHEISVQDVVRRSVVLTEKAMEEHQASLSISDDAYRMIEVPTRQPLTVLVPPTQGVNTIAEAPQTPIRKPLPLFTFATSIFDPESRTKSSYFLSYAPRAPTLDEFIVMLYDRHSLDQRLGVMKLRVFIMGDCVEIGVRAQHRDWDWNTVMGIVEERQCKVSVLFEVVSVHDM